MKKLTINETQLAILSQRHAALEAEQGKFQATIEMVCAQHNVKGRVVGWEAGPPPVLIVDDEPDNNPTTTKTDA